MKILPSRYRKKIKIDKQRGCWLWQGEVNHAGYGRAWYKNSRYVSHRLITWLLGGCFRLEDYDKELDHLCTTRHCCNPRHLEIVNRKKNVKRIHRRRKKIDESGNLVGGKK